MKQKRAWAAMWFEFDGPMAHTVRETRKEVAAHMAETWGTWKRAYRRGCRIVPVEIHRIDTPSEASTGAGDD